jgi:hypothetical protein
VGPMVVMVLAASLGATEAGGLGIESPSAECGASAVEPLTQHAAEILDSLLAGRGDELISPAAKVAVFGQRRSWRFNVHGAYGVDFENSDSSFIMAGLGLSYFILDDLGIEMEFNGLRIDQPGEDAWGFNFNLLLRWHVVSRETWSFYLDGGAGVLVSDEDVPDGTSEWNFTPQTGLGFSLDLGGDTRLLTGVRWFHISNANTDAANPGRDHYQFYAGLSFPF